jgi:serine/tyrosine/threonine adenylyltransferase
MPRLTETHPAATTGWQFDNSYLTLPDSFYALQEPIRVRGPHMAIFNAALAHSLGLDAEALNGEDGTALFAGNALPQGAQPLAQAYAGHQYGHFTMLGDGRAVLLGEQIAPDGQRFDIQLKGSGPTPFSRRGDGRAALGPMLREYLISEAMQALGIPTTRSLAVVTTGESVVRDLAVALPGAILTRVAASHIRVGTFEYIAARSARNEDDDRELRQLADYVIQRHYPECLRSGEGVLSLSAADLSSSDNPYRRLLQVVMERQALLVAKWQGVGFIHGVMNTDNMSICGETIDYGPCAFMDAYDPATVFSSIDRYGRYAYGNQPSIAQWNLTRFAEAILPLLHPNPEEGLAVAQEAINGFQAVFQRHYLAVMRDKLGLLSAFEPEDAVLVENLLTWMHQHQRDFTQTFRALSQTALSQPGWLQEVEFAAWHTRWQERLSRQVETPETVLQRMSAHNPAVIPRNHRVEEALKAAVEERDFSVLHRLLAVLQNPYNELPTDQADYSLPPEPANIPYQTFCGT